MELNGVIRLRKLAIAYGNSRQAKKWVNKEITYDELKDRLKTPMRTTESAEEYAKFSKAQKDDAKDHGGFVAGVLKGSRRKIDTVELRSMIALDGDRIDKEFLENYESLYGMIKKPIGEYASTTKTSLLKSTGMLKPIPVGIYRLIKLCM